MAKILIIILLLSLTSIYAESTPVDTTDIQFRINKLELEVKNLKSIVENKKLENRLNQAHEIIQSHDTIFSAFSTYFSLISIILTIFTISIPFLTYFFGIKPSQISINKLKKDLSKFIKENEKTQIKKSIENLLSKNVQTQKNAELYLSLNQHYEFDDQEYFQLYTHLDEELSESAKNIIILIILSSKNQYSEKVLKMLLEGDYNSTNDFFIAKYLAIIGIKHKISELVTYISKSKIKQHTFANFANYLSTFSYDELIDLLNSDEILNLFNKPEIKGLLTTIDYIFKGKKAETAFKETKLYKISNDA